MGEQNVLKRVVNHLEKNSVKELTIREQSNTCGITLHPAQGVLEVFIHPKSLCRDFIHICFFAGENQELHNVHKCT